MRKLAILSAVLLIAISMSFAAWDVQAAEGKLCFNVSTPTTVYNIVNHSYFTVLDVTVERNSSFWNHATQGYASSNFHIFPYAHNATSVKLFMPAQYPDKNHRYCLYSGASNLTDITEVGYIAGDGSDWTGWNLINNTRVYINTTSEYTNFSASGGAGKYAYYYRIAPVVPTYNMIAARFTSVLDSASYVGAFGYDSAATTMLKGAYGRTGAMYTYGTALYATTPDDIVYVTKHNANSVQSTMWGPNGSFVAAADGAGAAHSPRYILAGISVPSLTESKLQLDWIISGQLSAHGQNFTVSALSYEFQDPNITIVSPAWESTYSDSDTINLIVNFAGSYDNCTFYVDGTADSVTTSPGAQYISTLSTWSYGLNELNVSCNASGVNTHRYSYFYVQSSGAGDLFEDAFGFDISACPSATQQALGDACIEHYNITDYREFGAVVCRGLNMTPDYACLVSISNYTKNGYTIYYSPSWWSYPTSLRANHTGALFYYNGKPENVKMELFMNDSFVYLPAQDKPNDCNVYGPDASDCSYGYGFITRNDTVYVATSLNEWYTAAAPGGELDPEDVISVPLLPVYLSEYAYTSPGIFTRMTCYEANGTYTVRVTNTLQQSFIAYVYGTGAFAAASTGYSLEMDIPVYNDTDVVIYANGERVCQYAGQDNLFLPISFSWLGDGMMSIVPKLALVFAAVLGALIPYSLFIFFILNDITGLLEPQDLLLVGGLALVGGVVNAAFMRGKGLKSMLLLFGVSTGFLLAVARFGFGDYTPITGVVTSFDALFSGNSMDTFNLGNVLGIIGGIFILVLTLPAVVIDLVYSLIELISPAAAASLAPIKTALVVGALMYFYVKAYEVITNRQIPV